MCACVIQCMCVHLCACVCALGVCVCSVCSCMCMLRVCVYMCVHVLCVLARVCVRAWVHMPWHMYKVQRTAVRSWFPFHLGLGLPCRCFFPLTHLPGLFCFVFLLRELHELVYRLYTHGSHTVSHFQAYRSFPLGSEVSLQIIILEHLPSNHTFLFISKPARDWFIMESWTAANHQGKC